MCCYLHSLSSPFSLWPSALRYVADDPACLGKLAKSSGGERRCSRLTSRLLLFLSTCVLFAFCTCVYDTCCNCKSQTSPCPPSSHLNPVCTSSQTNPPPIPPHTTPLLAASSSWQAVGDGGERYASPAELILSRRYCAGRNLSPRLARRTSANQTARSRVSDSHCAMAGLISLWNGAELHLFKTAIKKLWEQELSRTCDVFRLLKVAPSRT